MPSMLRPSNRGDECATMAPVSCWLVTVLPSNTDDKCDATPNDEPAITVLRIYTENADLACRKALSFVAGTTKPVRDLVASAVLA